MKNNRSLITLIIIIALSGTVAAVCFVLGNICPSPLYTALFVTAVTVLYHLIMRIIVGEVVTLIFKNRDFHYNAAWYKQKKFEKKLYSLLKVKKWKGKMITARPELFDLQKITKKELLHNITQAEIVHEIIIPLSFCPLLLIIPYGEPLVFTLTSIGACLVDLPFVMIQRYNRPRIIKLLALTKG